MHAAMIGHSQCCHAHIDTHIYLRSIEYVCVCVYVCIPEVQVRTSPQPGMIPVPRGVLRRPQANLGGIWSEVSARHRPSRGLERVWVRCGRGVTDAQYTHVLCACSCVYVCGRRVQMQSKAYPAIRPALAQTLQILLAWLHRSSCIVGALVACRCGTDSGKLSCATGVIQHCEGVWAGKGYC